MAKKEEKFKVIKIEDLPLDFYAVRSKSGQWLKNKTHRYGYGYSTDRSWTDNIAEAKIYARPGPAKSQVTFWATNYPDFGVPDLVRIVVGRCEFLDQEERVKKFSIDKEKRESKKEVDYLEYQLEKHLLKIKHYRGDGQDKETTELRKKFEAAKLRYEKAAGKNGNQDIL